MKKNVVAIVPAAGVGNRFGIEKNKEFFQILDKPIVIWVLEKLQQCRLVNESIPVFSKDDMEMGLELIEMYNITKVKKIAPGGKERQDSVFNALKLVDDKASTIIIHDGVRPIVEHKIIEQCLNDLDGYDGVITGVKIKDTIKELKNNVIERTLDRDKLIAVQTPQVYTYETLRRAYERIQKKGLRFTDDAAVVEYSGGRIAVTEGSYYNIKITTPEDVIIAEAILKSQKKKM